MKNCLSSERVVAWLVGDFTADQFSVPMSENRRLSEFFHEPKTEKNLPRQSTSKWNFTKVNVRTCSGHDDEVNCVAFSRDLEMMVTGSDDGIVRVFNAATNRLITSLSGHKGPVRAVAVSPNSQFIASASQDKTIRLWKTRDASCLFVLSGHSKSVECLSFSFDSSLLCSGSWDKTAILWNVKVGTKCSVYREHKDLVQSTAFSHDGKYLATGSWDYTVVIWSIIRKQPPQHIHQQSTSELTEKESGKESGKIDPLHALTGHKGNIHALAFSPEGMLASGSWDKTIRLWNPRNGACLFCLEGHTGWVQSVCFSFDSLFLVSASEDDTVRIWNCTNGECTRQIHQTSTDVVSHCAFGPGTHDVIIVSGSASFTLNCYNKKNSIRHDKMTTQEQEQDQ